jgi:diacylglycerol kinase (ATP)
VRSQNVLLQRLPGEARFVWAALGALLAWREQDVRVTLDENAPREFTTNLLVFSNSRYAGGGMLFAPNASPDDGWFDALLSGGLKRRHILRELPRIRRGGHVANPKVFIQQARCARVEGRNGAQFTVEADSNPRGQTPLDLKILPGCLRIISPPA